MLPPMSARPARRITPFTSHAAVQPMAEAEARGPARDPRFPIPQYTAHINGVRTAFADSGGSHRAG